MTDWLTKEFGAAAIAALLAIVGWIDLRDELGSLQRELGGLERELERRLRGITREAGILRADIARAMKAVETLEAMPTISKEEQLLFDQITSRMQRIDNRVDIMTAYVARHSGMGYRSHGGGSGED